MSLYPLLPITPNITLGMVIGERSLTRFDSGGLNVKRGIRPGAERTKKSRKPGVGKEDNNNTKRGNYLNSIQART